jgi:toxin ParE1/3/4
VAEVKLSAAARRDLARIDEFSAAEFGGEVGDEYTRGLKAAFALLKRHPRAGEAHREYGPGVRCKLHRSHRIIYRIEGKTVLVQRILHHSQHVPKHLP